MSNSMITQSLGALPEVFRNQAVASSDLSSGISASFGHIGYKGKVWSIRYRGEERALMAGHRLDLGARRAERALGEDRVDERAEALARGATRIERAHLLDARGV